MDNQLVLKLRFRSIFSTSLSIY